MKNHWIDNLSGDWPARLRNKYHKYRGHTSGLPFRDYICKPPGIPISTEVPCPDILTYVPAVSSIYKINIGDSENDHNGDTIFSGLSRVNSNFDTCTDILSSIDSYIRSILDIDLLNTQSNWIEIPKTELPVDIQLGQWISRDSTQFILAGTDDAFSKQSISGELNPVGIISEIDPVSSVVRVTTSGLVSGVHDNLIPGGTYYLSLTAGDITTESDDYYYSKPVMTGLATDIGLVDIKIGEFKTSSGTRSSELYPDCIPYIPDIPSTDIKVEEITSEVAVTTSTPSFDHLTSQKFISEITSELCCVYIPAHLEYNTYRGLEEITSEIAIDSKYTVPSRMLPIWAEVTEISGEVALLSNHMIPSVTDSNKRLSNISSELCIDTGKTVSFTVSPN